MSYGMLTIQQAGRPDRYEPLNRPVIAVGRAPGSDIALDYPAVSGHHLRLEWIGDAYQVIDLNSTHGTVVDGQRINRPVRLMPRGHIWLGDALGNGVALVYSPAGEVMAEESK